MKDIIVTSDMLKQSPFNLDEGFIIHHARSMGSFGRSPRKFFLRNVLDHCNMLSEAAKVKAGQKKRDAEAHARLVDEIFNEVVAEMGYSKVTPIRKKKQCSAS